jgi:hypothetical protein
MRKWINVTTKPGVEAFAIELPTANWGDTWLSVMMLAAFSVVTSLLAVALYRVPHIPNMSRLTSDQQRLFNQLIQYARPSPGAAFGDLVGVPLGFFILVGILFLLSKLFGGTGTFLQQAYAIALYYVPISAVSAVAALIPGVGGLLRFALFIYAVVLAIFAIAASQRLTLSKSVAVVLLPLGILVILACAAAFIIAVAILAATQPH